MDEDEEGNDGQEERSLLFRYVQCFLVFGCGECFCNALGDEIHSGTMRHLMALKECDATILGNATKTIGACARLLQRNGVFDISNASDSKNYTRKSSRVCLLPFICADGNLTYARVC